jgi:uncharacterized protein
MENYKWYSKIKKHLSEITNKAAYEYWPFHNNQYVPFFNYRLEHILQVERDALKILENVKADKEIVIASVWIHDIFQPVYNGGKDHGEKAGNWATENIEKFGFPKNKIEDLCYSVFVHSSKPNEIPENKVEARILWDADKLNKIGAVSLFFEIMSQFASDNIQKNFLSNKNFEMQNIVNKIAKDIFSDMIKPEKEINIFYFEYSNKKANERFKIQNKFLKAFCEEAM